VLAAEVRLIESSGGVFEVVVDGRLAWSKKASGEFPDEARLVQRLRSG
jgi:selT/selW/selH-like putative selenoprotein